MEGWERNKTPIVIDMVTRSRGHILTRLLAHGGLIRAQEDGIAATAAWESLPGNVHGEAAKASVTATATPLRRTCAPEANENKSDSIQAYEGYGPALPRSSCWNGRSLPIRTKKAPEQRARRRGRITEPFFF